MRLRNGGPLFQLAGIFITRVPVTPRIRVPTGKRSLKTSTKSQRKMKENQENGGKFLDDLRFCSDYSYSNFFFVVIM